MRPRALGGADGVSGDSGAAAGGAGGVSGDSGAAAGGDFSGLSCDFSGLSCDFSGLSCTRAAANDVAEVKNAMTSENTSRGMISFFLSLISILLLQ